MAECENEYICLCQCSDFSFLELVLSAFLGFGSALLVEAIVSIIRNRKTKKQLLSDLVKELEAVKTTINNLNVDEVYIQPYAVPIWQGACDSGSILVLDKETYYALLLESFASVLESNLIEMKCFELIVAQKGDVNHDVLTNTLKQNRERLLKQITKALQSIKRGRRYGIWYFCK